MRLHGSTLIVALILANLAPGPNATAQPADSQNEGRMAWWRDAKFGMFIHWGVYSVPAGVHHGEQVPNIGEWIMRQGEIPVVEYKAYAKEFTASEFDPVAWARLAKGAGMRYVVITAKHHDGFALYDSAVTDWDAADASPCGEDLLSPLADAVRAEGLRFGLYYSQAQDWTHPGGAKWSFEEGQGWDPAHRGSFDDYLAKVALPQTREILERYDPDVLWWDTPVWMTAERAKPFHELVAARPMLITNDRLGGGYDGDTETPEQYIPATGFKDRDWETCMTMNDTWGFKTNDHNWKSTETLLTNLVDIVSKGGNYLLNVGPTKEGEIPLESINRLHEIGAWMASNGESIYGTTASPCRRPEWGRLTRKGDRLFLHVFSWPTGGKIVVPIEVDAVACRLLTEPSRSFRTRSTPDGLEVQLTGDAVDPVDSVVELRFAGEPTEIIRRVEPGADGALVLAAIDATTEGHLQIETIGDAQNLGSWSDAADTAEWVATLARPAAYQVSVEVAAPAASRCVLEVGGAELPLATAATGDYQTFRTQEVGAVSVSRAGDIAIRLRPEADGWNAINLRRIVLTPAD